MLEGLILAVDTKDRYTKRHSEDVARYADRHPDPLAQARLDLADDILFRQYLQWLASLQWQRARRGRWSFVRRFD